MEVDDGKRYYDRDYHAIVVEFYKQLFNELDNEKTYIYIDIHPYWGGCVFEDPTRYVLDASEPLNNNKYLQEVMMRKHNM